jgi:SAM-dependent methyltransferase
VTRNETLAECALRAPGVAAEHCDATHGCRPHHAIWPSLRLLELVGSPDAQEDIPFWRDALGALSRVEKPRVLLSGASDHGFLELIHGLLGTAGIRATLCLVDRCETPLELNRWYARRAGIELETFRAEILAFTPGRTFDAVLAHAFIDQLPAEKWPPLLAKWRELLHPGGRVVILNRLRSAPEAEAERAATASPVDFDTLIARRNLELPADLRLPMGLAPEIERCWRGRRLTPFRTKGEVVSLFEASGFSIEAAEDAFATVAGRSPSRSRRLRLIAHRP